jgi:hypothetical protein
MNKKAEIFHPEKLLKVLLLHTRFARVYGVKESPYYNQTQDGVLV